VREKKSGIKAVGSNERSNEGPKTEPSEEPTPLVWTKLPFNARTTRVAKVILVVAAFLMIGYRFLNLGLSPFILDEPQILRASYEQLQTGEWRSGSPLLGTQGLPYGPSAFWFYGLVQSFFGLDPAVSILAMCLLLSLSHVLLAGALARAFDGGWILFATLLAWVASSPYLFFWSRLAWDQLVIVCSTVAIALITRPRFGWAKATALGLALGIGLSAHLMILPLMAVVLVGLIIAKGWTPTAKRLTLLAASVLAFIAVNIPYGLFLLNNPTQSGPFPHPSMASLYNQLLAPARISTLWGIDYLFEGAWEDFLAFAGAAKPLFSQPFPTLAFAIAISVPGIIVATKSSAQHQKLIGILCLLAWLGYALAYGFFGIYPHAHYQFPTWWIISAGLAATLWWLWAQNRRLAIWIGAAVWIVALLQFYFVVSWVHYIRTRQGTQGVNYSVALDTQKRVIERACSAPEPEVSIEDYTLLFPASLEYLTLATEQCEHKRVRICEPLECAPTGPRHRLFRLTYSSAVGGAVSLE
jgi:4-amino-4-deoxy-L-arabinose transferase-like glycosyltransferase